MIKYNPENYGILAKTKEGKYWWVKTATKLALSYTTNEKNVELVYINKPFAEEEARRLQKEWPDTTFYAQRLGLGNADPATLGSSAPRAKPFRIVYQYKRKDTEVRGYESGYMAVVPGIREKPRVCSYSSAATPFESVEDAVAEFKKHPYYPGKDEHYAEGGSSVWHACVCNVITGKVLEFIDDQPVPAPVVKERSRVLDERLAKVCSTILDTPLPSVKPMDLLRLTASDNPFEDGCTAIQKRLLEVVAERIKETYGIARTA